MFLLCFLLTNVCATPASRAGSPGPAAAAAEAQLAKGDLDAGCAAFLAQVRAGTDDPWAVRGLALCGDADRVPAPDVLAALTHVSPPLGLLGQAFLDWLVARNAEAADGARRAVAADPELALGYHLLGAALKALDQVEAAVSEIEHALALAPDMTVAQNNLAVAHPARPDPAHPFW